MKTMVLEAPGVVALRELPMPVPAPGGALVRITHSGICGTDSKIFTGAIPARLPVVMGHEIVGEIAEGTAADGSGPGVPGSPKSEASPSGHDFLRARKGLRSRPPSAHDFSEPPPLPPPLPPPCICL